MDNYKQEYMFLVLKDYAHIYYGARRQENNFRALRIGLLKPPVSAAFAPHLKLARQKARDAGVSRRLIRRIEGEIRGTRKVRLVRVF